MMHPIPDWRLARMYERLADSIDDMTDKELLAEAVERGENPEDTRRRLQAMFREALNQR